MSQTRPIHLPAADFASQLLPVSVAGPFEAFRVHGSSFPAISFRLNPSHRFSHPDAPEGLLYLGEDLETCLWECFGDEILFAAAIAKVDWDKVLSRVSSSVPLRICDLTELRVRRALGMDLSAMKHPELDVPQAWGLAIQEHSAAVDGLRYLSRFTGRPCLALFERPGLAPQLQETVVSTLARLEAADDFLDANTIALV